MVNFIYIKNGSDKRGYNVNIRVYQIKNNKAHYVGDSDWQTAGWPGERGAAVRTIAKKFNFKHDGYSFKRKDIHIQEV